VSSERVGAVTITEVAGSPYYYARFRRHGVQKSRSLQTRDLLVAREKARAIADTLGPPRASETEDCSFLRFARQTIEDDRRRVIRGERSISLVRDGEQILKSYSAPILGKIDVRRITYLTLKEFVDELTDRELKVSSIKKILVHVNKALTTAHRYGALPALPSMPKIEGRLGVRGWFTSEEYKRLLRECKYHEQAKTKVRSQTITPELRFFVTFMVNTFLRPGDMKELRHRNIEIVRTATTRFIRITTETSKTTLAPVVSMPVGVEIYERLSKLQRSKGFGKPDDFLFLPKHKSRDFAIKEIGRMFKAVCVSARLDVSATGEPRSLYSLRHTAITFRLLKGNVDTVTLARAARTSVEMIDRFYASHLTAEMNVDKLQSMRSHSIAA
jgi:integrase